MLSDGIVRLRPVNLSTDIAAALPWYQDPTVLHYSEGSTDPFDLERIERMYSYLQQHGEVYIVEVLAGTAWQSIGDAALTPEMVPIVIGSAQYRSRHLGTRVLTLLVARARQLGWSKLVAHKIFDYNERSRHLFERAGFNLVDQGVDAQGRGYGRWELTL